MALPPSIRIRPFAPSDADYAAVAGVNASVSLAVHHDFEPRTAEGLRELDAAFDPARYLLRRFVAEVIATGEVVAYAHCFHMPWAFDPGHFWGLVRCVPAHRRRGIGGALAETMRRELDARDATLLRIEARENEPEMVALLERKGFTEHLRSWELDLDVGTFDAAPFERSRARALSSGVTLSTLPEEQAANPEWLEKLHSIYEAVTPDVPHPEVPNPDRSPAALRRYLLDEPSSLPDACLIAKASGRYVGFAVMHRSDKGPATIDHRLTCVRREERGRGIAMAIKLATIAYAAGHGYARIATWVESVNEAMLAINEKLGFVRKGGLIIFEKRRERPSKPGLRRE